MLALVTSSPFVVFVETTALNAVEIANVDFRCCKVTLHCYLCLFYGLLNIYVTLIDLNSVMNCSYSLHVDSLD